MSSCLAGPRSTIEPRLSTEAESRDLEREVDVLLDQEHRAPVVGRDPRDGLEERLDDEWGQAQAHLVDQEHLRLLDQRARHGEHLLLATRERPGAQPPTVPERREQVEHVAGNRAALVARDLEVLLAR